jgi:hypothetical protein
MTRRCIICYFLADSIHSLFHPQSITVCDLFLKHYSFILHCSIECLNYVTSNEKLLLDCEMWTRKHERTSHCLFEGTSIIAAWPFCAYEPWYQCNGRPDSNRLKAKRWETGVTFETASNRLLDKAKIEDFNYMCCSPNTFKITKVWRFSYFKSIGRAAHKTKKTPWSESASELYRPSDRLFSAKWLPTFADKGCHVVSVRDPYGRILGFLDRSGYSFIK